MLNNRDIDAVIVANGDFPSAEIPLQILQRAKIVICCDGGADEYIARALCQILLSATATRSL